MVQLFQGLPHLGDPFLQKLPLVDQQGTALVPGLVPLLVQLHILHQSLDLDPGGAEPFDKLHPLAGVFIIVPLAAPVPGDGGDLADALVLPKGGGVDVILLADL